MYRVFVRPPRELTLLKNCTLGWPHGTLSDASGKLVLSQMDEQLAWIPGFYGRDIAAGSTLQREFSRPCCGQRSVAVGIGQGSIRERGPRVRHQIAQVVDLTGLRFHFWHYTAVSRRCRVGVWSPRVSKILRWTQSSSPTPMARSWLGRMT